MAAYIRKRLLNFIIVMLGVSIFSFCLIALSGTDPAKVIALRSNSGASEAMIEQVREDLGLTGTLPERYVKWSSGILKGDWGYSVYSFRSVSEDFAQYFPTTIALVLLSLIWVVIISVPVSLLCALKPNGIFDHIVRAVTILGICVPAFWLGYLLLLLLAVKIPIFTVSPAPGIPGLILPSLTLALPLICSFIRLFRASLLEQEHKDYVDFARARGFSHRRILVNHVLHNALPPMVTLFCQYLGYLIAGGAVVESVFSLKGIGSYLIACISAGDSIAVASCVVVIAAVFVAANFAGDIVNRLLCPWMVRETNA